LPSTFEFEIEYQKALYTWINCFSYKKLEGVKVDKQVRQTGPFNDKTGPAYEAILEPLIIGWVIMVKDRNGPSADGWYWAQTEANPNTAYNNPPNYNPTWLDNYTSTELGVYAQKDAKGLKIPKPHFIYSGFSTGTCIRCHASSSSESTFSTLDNIDPDKEGLQFRVDNSWRAESYLNARSNGALSLIDKLMTFKETVKVDNDEVVINGKKIFNDYLKSIWYLPASQRPWVASDPKSSADADKQTVVDVRDAHLPSIEESKEDQAIGAIDAGQSGKTINKDFVKAFSALTKLKQPSSKEIERFSFPPAFADHSFSMKMNQELPEDHPKGPMTPELQLYITSDNCVGCHGGLGGAPSGVSQFLQTGPDYGTGYNISPYGERRWPGGIQFFTRKLKLNCYCCLKKMTYSIAN